MFETGGGSSQFTFGEGGPCEERFSLDLGAVPVTERFGLDRAVDEQTVAAAREAIASSSGRWTAARRSTSWSGSAARSRTSPASSSGSTATSPGACAGWSSGRGGRPADRALPNA